MHVCVCVYISVMRKKEIQPFAGTWMDLGRITLSKINLTEKDKYCMVPLICGIKKISNKQKQRVEK